MISQGCQYGVNIGGRQEYSFVYGYSNDGDRDVKISFMFNVDSTYNNNEIGEGYFIDGQRVDNFSIYTNQSEYLNQGLADVHNMDNLSATTGFSIVDADNALPFAVRVRWNNVPGVMPDTVAIGNYYDQIYDWDYYDNLSSNVGGSTDNANMAFSMIWSTQTDIASSRDGLLALFQYGITDIMRDTNLSGVPITYNTATQIPVPERGLWIQSGATNRDGMFIRIGEMNSDKLGIKDLNVTTHNDASAAIPLVYKGIEMISSQRTNIGAQQNRLEHAQSIGENTAENTQYAESRIRDTDMADEMVEHSKYNILQQAGQSMLAQANQSKQGILSLLQ